MKKNLFIAMLIIVATGVASYAAFAADQMRTTETLIYSSNSAISGAFNQSFTLYIGDNISGITNPVKSLYFVASGVYTQGGTINFKIDSDEATSQTFTLPNVSAPTPFELIYKDPSNKINPTSGGSYGYTLYVTPSGGITLYGLGIRMRETHRYVPASCDDGVTTNEKIKSTSALIYSSNSAISGAFNQSFTLYIGDNISGITNPVKSLYFVASGVYTQGGTINFKIDSDEATSQTFTLPNVSAPTPFELIYKDPSNKINPTSGGSYGYTLYVTPSGGITLYGLGVKLNESHRYKPPACGGNAYGDLTSAVFDTGLADGATFNSIMWKGTAGTGKANFQFAASNSSGGPWNFYGGTTCGAADWFDPGAPNTPIELRGTTASSCQTEWNNKRYFRYKIRVCLASNCTDTAGTSPVVEDVVVSWAP